MKKNKIIIFFALLFCILNTNIYSNPFYSLPPSSQSDQEENNEQKEVVPVTVIGGKATDLNIKVQKDIRANIASLLNTIKETKGLNRIKVILLVLALSFIYGIIHAAGPGHRKMIVFSMYLTRKASWYEPIFTGSILAFLHGGCAILLIMIYKGITKIPLGANTNKASIYLEGFSYLIIISMSIFMLIKETIEYIRNRKKEIEIKDTSKLKLVPFLLSGIYPCPGALLILIFTYTLDLLSFGVLCVISMSVGMGIVIITVAYLAKFGRTKILSLACKNKLKIGNITFAIEILSYVFILLFSIFIAFPFLKSLTYHFI